jgi:hypothetical protein
MSLILRAVPKKEAILVVLNSLLGAYFVFAAAVQYNDPDPVHWMLFYGTSALCCVLAAMQKGKLPLLYALVGMAIIEIGITGDGFLVWLRLGQENLITTKMSADKPYIELGREFLGALISLVVALWQVRLAKKSAHP